MQQQIVVARAVATVGASHESEPTFIMVRTISGKPFVCKARRAMTEAIASCRGAKLSLR